MILVGTGEYSINLFSHFNKCGLRWLFMLQLWIFIIALVRRKKTLTFFHHSNGVIFSWMSSCVQVQTVHIKSSACAHFQRLKAVLCLFSLPTMSLSLALPQARNRNFMWLTWLIARERERVLLPRQQDWNTKTEIQHKSIWSELKCFQRW